MSTIPADAEGILYALLAGQPRPNGSPAGIRGHAQQWIDHMVRLIKLRGRANDTAMKVHESATAISAEAFREFWRSYTNSLGSGSLDRQIKQSAANAQALIAQANELEFTQLRLDTTAILTAIQIAWLLTIAAMTWFTGGGLAALADISYLMAVRRLFVAGLLNRFLQMAAMMVIPDLLSQGVLDAQRRQAWNWATTGRALLSGAEYGGAAMLLGLGFDQLPVMAEGAAPRLVQLGIRGVEGGLVPVAVNGITGKGTGWGAISWNALLSMLFHGAGTIHGDHAPSPDSPPGDIQLTLTGPGGEIHITIDRNTAAHLLEQGTLPDVPGSISRQVGARTITRRVASLADAVDTAAGFALIHQDGSVGVRFVPDPARQGGPFTVDSSWFRTTQDMTVTSPDGTQQQIPAGSAIHYRGDSGALYRAEVPVHDSTTAVLQAHERDGLLHATGLIVESPTGETTYYSLNNPDALPPPGDPGYITALRHIARDSATHTAATEVSPGTAAYRTVFEDHPRPSHDTSQTSAAQAPAEQNSPDATSSRPTTTTTEGPARQAPADNSTATTTDNSTGNADTGQPTRRPVLEASPITDRTSAQGDARSTSLAGVAAARAAEARAAGHTDQASGPDVTGSSPAAAEVSIDNADHVGGQVGSPATAAEGPPGNAVTAQVPASGPDTPPPDDYLGVDQAVQDLAAREQAALHRASQYTDAVARYRAEAARHARLKEAAQSKLDELTTPSDELRAQIDRVAQRLSRDESALLSADPATLPEAQSRQAADLTSRIWELSREETLVVPDSSRRTLEHFRTLTKQIQAANHEVIVHAEAQMEAEADAAHAVRGQQAAVAEAKSLSTMAEALDSGLLPPGQIPPDHHLGFFDWSDKPDKEPPEEPVPEKPSIWNKDVSEFFGFGNKPDTPAKEPAPEKKNILDKTVTEIVAEALGFERKPDKPTRRLAPPKKPERTLWQWLTDQEPTGGSDVPMTPDERAAFEKAADQQRRAAREADRIDPKMTKAQKRATPWVSEVSATTAEVSRLTENYSNALAKFEGNVSARNPGAGKREVEKAAKELARALNAKAGTEVAYWDRSNKVLRLKNKADETALAASGARDAMAAIEETARRRQQFAEQQRAYQERVDAEIKADRQAAVVANERKLANYQKDVTGPANEQLFQLQKLLSRAEWEHGELWKQGKKTEADAKYRDLIWSLKVQVTKAKEVLHKHEVHEKSLQEHIDKLKDPYGRWWE